MQATPCMFACGAAHVAGPYDGRAMPFMIRIQPLVGWCYRRLAHLIRVQNKEVRMQTASRNSGFTLIELMIVVVIVGILAMIALPIYENHVIRGNRSAAQAAMMDIANRQQQHLLANRVYAIQAELNYPLGTEVSGHYGYGITVDNNPADGTPMPSFTITFTPTGRQAKDGVLTLNSQGVKTPAEKWQR